MDEYELLECFVKLLGVHSSFHIFSHREARKNTKMKGLSAEKLRKTDDTPWKQRNTQIQWMPRAHIKFSPWNLSKKNVNSVGMGNNGHQQKWQSRTAHSTQKELGFIQLMSSSLNSLKLNYRNTFTWNGQRFYAHFYWPSAGTKIEKKWEGGMGFEQVA